MKPLAVSALLPFLCSPFKVYDIRSRSVIYRSVGYGLDGPVPESLYPLPVLRVYCCNDIIYIDVEV